MPISRRQFAIVAGAAGALAPTLAAAEPLTAELVIRRIQTQLGGDWPSKGPDTFRAGDPSTAVKGIATTAMATLDVLKQAANANTNLILTFEPAFYSRADGPAPGGLAADDPVFHAKREFIARNNLVVFRLRDHWQARKENDMVKGLADALGWSEHRVGNDDSLYDITPATAEQIVATIRARLRVRGGLRAVGDRKAVVRRVLLFPGAMTPEVMWRRYADVDLIVAGEVREWENTHYAADMFTAGQKRALVTIGRVVSEEPGMRLCAAWLKSVAPEVPAKWLVAGDPYWSPAS